MCNCIQLLEDALKDTNTDLDYSISLFNTDRPNMLKIATLKKNARSREKAKAIYASYCPVCGVKYESAE